MTQAAIKSLSRGLPTDENPVTIEIPLANERVAAVPSDAFVRAMRGAAATVTIVSTDGEAGRFALTVSAFASLSAHPPMVLVCIHQRSPVGDAITSNQRFCVNLLSSDQQRIADVFAGRPAEGAPYDFNVATWRKLVTGAPVLVGALASFDCKLAASIYSGSHRIFIGRVAAVTSEVGRALIYANRAYGQAFAS